MKTKTVKRYYCEHCKKSGQSASHIRRHEERCTGNPNRKCGICSGQTMSLQSLVSMLVKDPFEDGFKPESQTWVTKDSFEAMRAEVECPACILWVMRSAKAYVDHWDFKSAQKEYWDEKNNAALEVDGNY